MEKHDIFSNLKTGVEDILREGARKLLQQAIENEVLELIDFYKDQKDEVGKRAVKRNGYLPHKFKQDLET